MFRFAFPIVCIASLFVSGRALAEVPSSAESSPVRPTENKDLGKGAGIAFEFSTGVLVPAGRFATPVGFGMGSFGAGLSGTAALSFYPWQHVGLVVGGRGSYSHAGTEDCDKTKSACGGYTLQLPILAEYAFDTRARGPFVRGGVGLFTTYNAYDDGGTAKFTSSLPELKLGGGYRFGNAATGHFSFDVLAMIDFGQFSHIEVHSASGSVNDDIRKDKTAYHAAFDINVAMHWGQ